MVSEAARLPNSVWAATATPASPYQSLSRDTQVDVAVVGAGFTGLSCALHLAERGYKVAVLDAFEPGWGASGRNGGQIIAGLKHDPDELESTFGPRLGKAMVREFGAGADLVSSLVERYAIACDLRRTGWIQGAHGPKAFESVVRPRFEQWKARGVDARLLGREETASLIGSDAGAYCGGWLDPRGGVLQPLSYARGLAVAAMSKGAAIYAGTPARRLLSNGSGWKIETDGPSISAGKVVLATNAYTDDLWPGLRQTVIPVTSFQIATKPLPAGMRQTLLPGGQGVSDTRRLLIYFRLDPDGRLLMGGRSPVEDNPTLEDAAPLKAVIARIFPHLGDVPIEFVWSGKVAITKDKMPHIHMLAPGLFAALGFNGRGVAASTVAGKWMAGFVGGMQPDDLPLPVTAPDRFVFHGFRKLGVFAMSQYFRLLDRLESRE